MDDDVGYGVLRVTRDQRWKPFNLGNLLFNTMLALGFEWGVGLQHLELGKIFKGRDDRAGHAWCGSASSASRPASRWSRTTSPIPALTSLSPGATFRSTLTANAIANVIRNVWANAVIFCGHFPDGAEKFTKTDMVGETKGQWYLRQMLGSANFEGGPAAAVHERQPVPSDRASPVSRICRATGCTRSRSGCRQLCDKYDLPYTTGSFLVQYGKTWRTIAKLSLPDKYLRDTADDAPETRSERMFAELGAGVRDDRSRHRAQARAARARSAAVRKWRRDKRTATRKATSRPSSHP